MSGGASIDIVKDGHALSSVALDPKKRQWTVGRSLDSDICINHPSVSRAHCRISEEDGAYFISDLGSVHGTKMNEVALPPNCPMRLFDGLRISLGNSSRALVPRGTVASVVAAVRDAAKQQAASEKLRLEAEDEDEDDEGESAASGTSGGTTGTLSASAAAELRAQEAEDEEMRAFLPTTFGKQAEIASAPLERQHADFARKPVQLLSLQAQTKARKGKLQMAAQLGTSLKVVPTEEPATAEPTTAEALAAAMPPPMAPPPPKPRRKEKQIAAEETAEVGPALPPGFANGSESGGEVEAGPALPPGFDVSGPTGGSAGMYDPNDLSQQVFGEDEEEEEDEAEQMPRVPVSHQVALRAHNKTVTCLALDRGGGRLVSGSSDHDIYFWDFAGMTKELKPFRHLEEPLGGYQIRSIDYSPNADQLVVAGSSNQPICIDRDGRKLGTFMRGDMYIRDMRHTKGHVAATTVARWCPSDRATVATAGEDGTMRLWDVEVAMARDDNTLSVQGGQKTVLVTRDAKGIKTACTAMAWHPDGHVIMAGGRDGSLQLWESRSSAYKPVELLIRQTPKYEDRAAKLHPDQVCRAAHVDGSDVSCVRWKKDGHVCASRSTDGSLKLWDIRRFHSPLAEWGGLPSIFPMAGCDFSPDESLVCAGTSVKKGQGAPQLAFYSLRTLQEVARVDLDGASIVPIIWHPRLNQILLGNADGAAYALYDPTMSEKGVMYCNVKAAPKRSALSFTGGNVHVMTPHALPMFRDENLDHKRKRTMDRNDPLKSRKPEQVMSGPGTGGRTNVGYQQALLATMSGGISGLGGTKDKIEMFQREDPREELLKYAKLAEEDPIYVTPAYAKSQPQVLQGSHLAKTVDPDEEDRDGDDGGTSR